MPNAQARCKTCGESFVFRVPRWGGAGWTPPHCRACHHAGCARWYERQASKHRALARVQREATKRAVARHRGEVR